MPHVPVGAAVLEPACMNAWRDFNDAAALPEDGGTEIPTAGKIAIDGIPTGGQSIHINAGTVAVDPAVIATFLDVVFGYCDGVIPVRGFVDQGQGFDTRPHNIWIPADATAADPFTLRTVSRCCQLIGSPFWKPVNDVSQAPFRSCMESIDLDAGAECAGTPLPTTNKDTRRYNPIPRKCQIFSKMTRGVVDVYFLVL